MRSVSSRPRSGDAATVPRSTVPRPSVSARALASPGRRCRQNSNRFPASPNHAPHTWVSGKARSPRLDFAIPLSGEQFTGSPLNALPWGKRIHNRTSCGSWGQKQARWNCKGPCPPRSGRVKLCRGQCGSARVGDWPLPSLPPPRRSFSRSTESCLNPRYQAPRNRSHRRPKNSE
jgi:hypothetical protein